MLIIGLGDIFEADSNVKLAVQSEIAMNFGSETISIPAGDTSSNITIQVAQPVTGTFRFRNVNAGILTALTAGTNVVSSGSATAYRYQKESGTVDGSDEITLSVAPAKIDSDYVMSVDKRGGEPYERVDSAPSSGQYAWTTGTTLTFQATVEQGNTFDVTFFSAESAGANRVFTLTPTALAPSRHMVVGMKLFSQYTAAFKSGGIVVDMLKVTRTSDMGPVGAAVGDSSVLGFDWEATNTADGDVRMYLASEGVHQ